MRGLGIRGAQAVVRLWTRVYTWRLPGDLRQRRTEEIDSDLWEDSHEPSGDGGHAGRTIARLLLGMPDDLGWRIEQEARMRRARTWMLAVPAAACGIVVVAFWAGLTIVATDPPPSPQSPRAIARLAVAPEPPLPPPPPAPPGSKEKRPPAGYATTVYRPLGNGESPRLKNHVRVVYPPIARSSDLEGTVVVRATVNPNGRLSDTHVVRSIPVCDEAVLDALRRWEFSPTTIDGRPVATPIEVLAKFKR